MRQWSVRFLFGTERMAHRHSALTLDGDSGRLGLARAS